MNWRLTQTPYSNRLVNLLRSGDLPRQKTCNATTMQLFNGSNAPLKRFFPDEKSLICSRLFTQPPRGIFSKRSGVVPYSEGQRFFLYKAFKLDKNPRTFTTQVFQPRQTIHSFPGEQVNNGREENCSFFENFSSQFSEKMFKREIFNKRGIIKLPRIKRFAFATRLPAGKWPSVRFAIQRTNKNSKLVAVSR